MWKPKLTFSLIFNRFFYKNDVRLKYPSVIINAKAKNSDSTFIGPNCVIGNAEIFENCKLFRNVHVGDSYRIGSNVVTESDAVIKSSGFSYLRNCKSNLIHFPQIGGVELRNCVHIGANSCVNQGSLGNTIIKSGTKINNLVHIAHNLTVGENVVITTKVIIAGSVKIDDNCWIAHAYQF